MGQGGTLGSNFVLGAGAAISAQLLGNDRVIAVFFGDGAAARGTFHEAALQASVWKLPVVWICENNGWAISAPIARAEPDADIADRAAGYGMPGVVVDGQDALAVHAVTVEAVDARPRRRRADADRGQDAADPRPLRGRPAAVPRPTRRRQPRFRAIRSSAARARRPPRSPTRLDEAARAEVEEALAAALAAPRRRPDDRSSRTSGRERATATPRRRRAETTISYARAINQALAEEMRRDERVWMMGQDIGRMGGVFGVTRGLLDEFGAAARARHDDQRDVHRRRSGRRGDDRARSRWSSCSSPTSC